MKAGEAYGGMVSHEGTNYVSYFEPVMLNGKVADALAIRANVDKILTRVQAATKAIKVGHTGYAFIIAPGKTLEETAALPCRSTERHGCLFSGRINTSCRNRQSSHPHSILRPERLP